jgi:hypothetical protein
VGEREPAGVQHGGDPASGPGDVVGQGLEERLVGQRGGQRRAALGGVDALLGQCDPHRPA